MTKHLAGPIADELDRLSVGPSLGKDRFGDLEYAAVMLRTNVKSSCP